MNEIELLNKAFIYLSIESESYVHNENLTHYIGNIQGINIERLLETLWKIGFADRAENKQATMSRNHPFFNYRINSIGIHFIEKLPSEYKDLPYTYHIKLQTDKIL